MKKLVLAVSVLSLFAIFASQVQAIPESFRHQGFLTDDKGVPIDGSVNMTLSIYDVLSGGTSLWSETKTVTVNKGVYNFTLGVPTPFNLPFDVPYFLGVTIGTDAEMTPRTRLRSVPYAMRAAVADSVKADVVTAVEIAAGAVANDEIAAGAVTDDKITGPIAGGKVDGSTMTGVNAEKLAGLSINDMDKRYAVLSQVPRVNGLPIDIVTGSDSYVPSLTIGADSLPIMSFNTADELNVAKCLNADCSSFQLTTHDSATAGPTSIAIGTDGLPVISYYSVQEDSFKVLKCGDLACSSGLAQKSVIRNNVSGGKGSSIAIGIDGLPRVAIIMPDTRYLVKCLDQSCSQLDPQTYQISFANWAGVCDPTPVKNIVLAITVTGNPVVAWVTEGLSLMYGYCEDPNCSTSVSNWVTPVAQSCGEPSVNVNDTDFSLAIGGDYTPILVYSSRLMLEDRLTVLKFADKEGKFIEGQVVLESDDDPDNSIRYPALSTGRDGWPSIAYWVEGAGLRFAHCFNSSCSSGTYNPYNIVTIDSGTQTTGVSVSTGVDGNPLIAYAHEGPGLKLMQCTNPLCLNSWSRR